MTLLLLIFWLSLFLVFFNYIGYAVIPGIVNYAKREKERLIENYFPAVSFIVAAYNEEDVIEQKILDSLQQSYPADKIEFIFITDGSSDTTPAIIANYSHIKLLHETARKGKSAALNRAVASATNDIIIISDANTVLNTDAVALIARHYHANNVGGVAGEKKVISLSEKDKVGASEGLYWKYESFLKKTDSNFYSVVGAAGELFSFRKSFFEAVPENVILDDFVISMRIAEKGYRIMYEPEAYAMETASSSMKDEEKRKIRIAAGGFQAIAMLKDALKFWRHPRLTYLYISHRVLRWAVSPFCLILTFISNAFICFVSNMIFYQIFLILQIAFYLSAFTERLLQSNNKSFKPFKLPYYFVFMNVSVLQGFVRHLTKKQSATWEKAKRAESAFNLK